MPVSPNIGADYGEEVAALYRDAELRTLARITDALREGMPVQDWELATLARAQDARERILADLAQTNAKAADAIRAALADAYERGGQAALADLGSNLPAMAGIPPQQIAAVEAIVAEVIENTTRASASIVRAVDDVFRDVVAEVAQSVATNASSRMAAAQAAFDTFVGQGITTFEAANGARWSIANYTSMAVRTSTARTALAGTINTARDNGFELVVVHPGPRACDVCDFWARSILTLDPSGARGTVEVPSAADPSQTVEVEVDGSLDDARDDGWGHPNCRCALQIYLPGVTDASIIDRPPWDAEAYAAQQEQRRLEAAIRAAKTDGSTALTDERAEQAAARVEALQAEVRALIAENPDLKRQYGRESPGVVR